MANSHVLAPAMLLGAWTDTILGTATVGVGIVTGVGSVGTGVGTDAGGGLAAEGVDTGDGVGAGGDVGTESERSEGTSGAGALGVVLDGAGAQPATSATSKINRIMVDFILDLCQLLRIMLLAL